MALSISDMGSPESHTEKDKIVTLRVPFPLPGSKLSTAGTVFESLGSGQ